MLSAINQIYLRALFLDKEMLVLIYKKKMEMWLWNFPSAMSGQIKVMEQPCAWRGMWGTARASSDLGWRGDRSYGPCSVLPIRFLSYRGALQRPVWIFAASHGCYHLLPQAHALP